MLRLTKWSWKQFLMVPCEFKRLRLASLTGYNQQNSVYLWSIWYDIFNQADNWVNQKKRLETVWTAIKSQYHQKSANLTGQSQNFHTNHKIIVWMCQCHNFSVKLEILLRNYDCKKKWFQKWDNMKHIDDDDEFIVIHTQWHFIMEIETKRVYSTCKLLSGSTSNDCQFYHFQQQQKIANGTKIFI